MGLTRRALFATVAGLWARLVTGCPIELKPRGPGATAFAIGQDGAIYQYLRNCSKRTWQTSELLAPAGTLVGVPATAVKPGGWGWVQVGGLFKVPLRSV